VNRWFLVGIIVACNASGDLMNTLGMRRYGRVEDLAPRGLARLVRALARNGFVVGGVIAMAIAFFSLLALLSVASVSFAVPATAGSCLVETLLAKIILKEEVHWRRWLGAVVVSCGVALLALS